MVSHVRRRGCNTRRQHGSFPPQALVATRQRRAAISATNGLAVGNCNHVAAGCSCGGSRPHKSQLFFSTWRFMIISRNEKKKAPPANCPSVRAPVRKCMRARVAPAHTLYFVRRLNIPELRTQISNQLLRTINVWFQNQHPPKSRDLAVSEPRSQTRFFESKSAPSSPCSTERQPHPNPKI